MIGLHLSKGGFEDFKWTTNPRQGLVDTGNNVGMGLVVIEGGPVMEPWVGMSGSFTHKPTYPPTHPTFPTPPSSFPPNLPHPSFLLKDYGSLTGEDS